MSLFLDVRCLWRHNISRFGEICWHNMRVILHALSLLLVVQCVTVINILSEFQVRRPEQHSTQRQDRAFGYFNRTFARCECGKFQLGTTPMPSIVWTFYIYWCVFAKQKKKNKEKDDSEVIVFQKYFCLFVSQCNCKNKYCIKFWLTCNSKLAMALRTAVKGDVWCGNLKRIKTFCKCICNNL